jgi:hypothetical protein
VVLSSSLDDDSQGAQFPAPRIPNRGPLKWGPRYAFPDIQVGNGSTGRGAVLLPPGQSTKHPSLLFCRYFLTPLNTRDSIDGFKRALSPLPVAAPFSMPTSYLAGDLFKRAGERDSEMETDIVNDDEVKENFSRERRKLPSCLSAMASVGPSIDIRE